MAQLKSPSLEGTKTIVVRKDYADGIGTVIPETSSSILGRGSLQRGYFSGIMNETTGYGTSVKIWGNYVAVGDHNYDGTNHANAGAIHVYTTDGVLINTIKAPEVDTVSYNFGGDSNTWCIYGDYLVAGFKYINSTAAAKVWVFHIHTGEIIREFDIPGTESFRPVVDLEGCWLALSNQLEAGSRIYVYHILTGDIKVDSAYGDYDLYVGIDTFVKNIKMNRTWITVAVSTSGNEDRLYVYNYKNKILYGYLPRVTQDINTALDLWGYAMCIAGEYVAVSAPYDDYIGGTAGHVTVYDIMNGSVLFDIYNPNIQTVSPSDYFGYSLTIMGEHLFVGAPYEDTTSKTTNTGRIYCYSLRDGSLIGTLTTNFDFNEVDDLDDYAGWAMDSFSDMLVWTKLNKGVFISKMNEPAAIIQTLFREY